MKTNRNSKKAHICAVINLVACVAIVALFACTFFFVGVQGDDYTYILRAKSGFFDAVEHGATEIGDGIVGAFLRTALVVLPAFAWKTLGVIVLALTILLAAVLASGTSLRGFKELFKKSDDRDDLAERRLRFSRALLVCSTMFAAIDITVLRTAVFCISGLIHYLIPTALLLLFIILAKDSALPSFKSSIPLLLIAGFASIIGPESAIAFFAVAILLCFGAMKRTTSRITLILASAIFAVLCAVAYRSASMNTLICGAIYALIVLIGMIPEIKKASPKPPLLAVIAFVSLDTLAYHVHASNVPVFPTIVPNGDAVRGMMFTILAQNGLFVPILVFCVIAAGAAIGRKLIPAVREKRTPIAIFSLVRAVLCATSAIALVLYSPLIASVTVSFKFIVPLLMLTFVLCAIDIAMRFCRAKDTVSLLLMLGCAALLVLTFITRMYHGASLYAAAVLAMLICARAICDDAPVIASALGASVFALFAATISMAGTHLVLAVAIVLICGALSLAPAFKKVRPASALAVCFALLAPVSVVRGYRKSAAICEINERTIECCLTEELPVITLYRADTPHYGIDTADLVGEAMTSYRHLHDIDDDTPIVFTSQSATPCIVHTFAADGYAFDAEAHWYPCTICGLGKAIEAHSFDDNCDESCDVCGYKRKAPHSYDDRSDLVCNDCGAARLALIPGDVNDDGAVDDADLSLIKRYLSGSSVPDLVFEGADADQNGKVNAKDMNLIAKMIG